MTNTYKENAPMNTKMYEELRCTRCVLERLLNHLNSSAFVDYQMEKFGKDYKTEEQDEQIEKDHNVVIDPILTRIKQFDLAKDKVMSFVEFLCDIWHQDFGSMKLHKEKDEQGYQTLEIHTGGWSENEEILMFLEQTMFWGMFWYKSERGGHYWLKVKEIPELTDKPKVKK